MEIPAYDAIAGLSFVWDDGFEISVDATSENSGAGWADRALTQGYGR